MMSNENINDTLPEEEVQVEETTEQPQQEDTVEDFSDKLDAAETEEEALEVFKEVVTEDEPTDTDEPELDTEADDNVPKTFKLKDGDIEIELDLTSEEDRRRLVMLGQQGLNYAGKTTELAKYRSFVNYAEENGISLEDIQALADIKAGKKEALAKIAKTADIDLYDVDSEMADKYNPEPPQLNIEPEPDPMLDTIANEILSNEEYKSTFQKWFPTMPPEVQNIVTSDPNALNGVKEDIEAGVFAPAMEQAYKYQRINGMDFPTAYLKAKQEVMTVNPIQEQPTQQEPSREELKRVAAPRTGGGAPSGSSRGLSVGVISDMSDDEFLKNYHDIIRQVQTTQG